MITRQLKADIAEALDLSKLALPPRPRVEEVQWHDIIDQIGDEALDVLVVLGADTTPDERDWPALKPIEDAIFARVRSLEISLFPYVRIITRTELELEKVGKWA